MLALVVSCVVALCLMVGEGEETRAQVPPERPNIVFVLTDDMDEGLLKHMPAVQARLERHGVKFTNAFVTLPLCCPSRATTLTGQYAHNHQVLSNAPPEGGEPRFRELGLEPTTQAGDESTIATWLQQSGYKTGLVGKYLNEYKDTYVPPGWTEWHATVGNGGGRNGDTLNDNGVINSYDQYPTDLYRSKAVNFIRNTEEPFFLWVGFNAPHSPAYPAPRHAQLFGDLKVPRPPSFNERDVSDKPLWVRSLPNLDADNVRNLSKFQRNRVRSLLSVDEAVDAMMNYPAGRGGAQQHLLRLYLGQRPEHGRAQVDEEGRPLRGVHRGPAGDPGPARRDGARSGST